MNLIIMYSITRHILFLACNFLACLVSYAQQPGVYIPKKAKIFFSQDTATIFSNVVNHGRMGIGKKAVINFKGKSWQNDAEARIIDETDTINGSPGNGGHVYFNADDKLQQLDGGFNAVTREGSIFTGLFIRNKFGIELLNSSAKVSNEITLLEGLVFLRDQVLIVGHGHPGIINGYTPTKFFVTGNAPGTGLLLREKISSSDGQVIFPIGSKQYGYTPAGIIIKTGTADDFYVNVFDDVRSWLTSGPYLKTNSVNKTWEVGKLVHSFDNEVELSLQHLNADEGPAFQLNRATAFVSQYQQNGWDEGAGMMMPAIGYMTTGGTLLNSGVNKRTFKAGGSSNYFTKFSSTLSNKTDLIFFGHRLNYKENSINWITYPEINIARFIVQRRLYNEQEFTNVDTVRSKALNGVSTEQLNYNIVDPNDFSGISFYRLQIISLSNDTTYSNIISIAGTPGRFNALVWPNPTPDKFFIGLTTTMQVKYVFVYNALGQKVREELVARRTLIQMGGLRPGTYTVTVVSSIGEIVAAKKLIVIGR